MFYRWRRMGEANRGRVWRLYGWFSGLMMCGSCVGVVAWASNMIALVNIFTAYDSADWGQRTSLLALAHRLTSAFLVTYGLEFLCLSAAKLMVLDRMSSFAAPQGALDRRPLWRWVAAGRAVMAVVVLGNAVGFAANVAAVVHYHQAAYYLSAASALYAANKTNDGDDDFDLSQKEVQIGGFFRSMQSFCEVAVLLLIVTAFVAVGALSARRVSSRLQSVEAASSASSATGRALRLQILGTTGFVFVSFVVRSVHSAMLAFAFQFRDNESRCSDDFCDPCYTLYTLISRWMMYTPEFQLTIVLISSPLTLLVALWGMTTRFTLQLMKSAEREPLFSLNPMASTRQGCKPKPRVLPS
jgi:hypothetical protein